MKSFEKIPHTAAYKAAVREPPHTSTRHSLDRKRSSAEEEPQTDYVVNFLKSLDAKFCIVDHSPAFSSQSV
jgi:hypothetical protein